MPVCHLGTFVWFTKAEETGSDEMTLRPKAEMGRGQTVGQWS